MRVTRVLSHSLKVGLVEINSMLEAGLAPGLFVLASPGVHGAPHAKGQGLVRAPVLPPAPTGSPVWPLVGQGRLGRNQSHAGSHAGGLFAQAHRTSRVAMRAKGQSFTRAAVSQRSASGCGRVRCVL